MTTEEKHVRKLTILSEHLCDKERLPIHQASPGTESKKIIQANPKTTQVVTLNQDHSAKGKCSWLNTAPSLFHACLIWPVLCCCCWFDFHVCKVSQEETALGFGKAGLGLQPTHPQATSDRILELLTFLGFAVRILAILTHPHGETGEEGGKYCGTLWK